MAKSIRISAKDIESLKPVIEAIIFAADTPINGSSVLGLIAGVRGGAKDDRQNALRPPDSPPDLADDDSEDSSSGLAQATLPDGQVSFGEKSLRTVVEALNMEYQDTGRAMRIVEVAGGYQFATLRQYGEYVAMLARERQRRRLSPAALETLAIIAYRQPVSKPDIESVRGVNCDQVLLSLIEKNLVAITGRSEHVGRPLLYSTTEDFLRVFGLKDLKDMPKLRELEELMEEGVHQPEGMEVVIVDRSENVEQIEEAILEAGTHHPPYPEEQQQQNQPPGPQP